MSNFRNVDNEEARLKALYIASARNAIESTTNLLKAGTDPNKAIKRNGWTPLMIATLKGFGDIVNLLIQYNVNVDLQNKNGATALYIACENNATNIATNLLKGGADPNIKERSGWTPLMIAILKGFDDIVNLLFQYNVDVDLQNRNGDTALYIACENNAVHIATDLLKSSADPNIKKRNGWTPLMIATVKGFGDIVNLLLQYNVDVDLQSIGGGTALSIACENDAIHIAAEILKGGADPNITIEDTIGQIWTPLMIATMKGFDDIVNLLIQYNVNVNLKNRIGATALYITIMFGNNVIHIATDLLKSGADPNIKTNDGWTPLMIAMLKGFDDIIVNLLIQYNVNVDLQNNNGATALYIACENNAIHGATALLKSSADPNIKERSGWTPLMIATAKGFGDIVNLLLQYNVDVDAQNTFGDTALHIACKSNAIHIATDLLKSGADPTISNTTTKQTPLMLALSRRYDEMVILLTKI